MTSSGAQNATFKGSRESVKFPVSNMIRYEILSVFPLSNEQDNVVCEHALLVRVMVQ